MIFDLHSVYLLLLLYYYYNVEFANSDMVRCIMRICLYNILYIAVEFAAELTPIIISHKNNKPAVSTEYSNLQFRVLSKREYITLYTRNIIIYTNGCTKSKYLWFARYLWHCAFCISTGFYTLSDFCFPVRA